MGNEKKTFYVTTPIYYPSDKLHIGNAYTTVIADTIARYKRQRGFDVFFLTGTDEHGQKIQRVAESKGLAPKDYLDGMAECIKGLWKLLNISYDRFIRTTDSYHEESVAKIFKKLYDKGDIYKSSYEGLYCTPCESFWTDTQAVGGKCPDCGRPVEVAREEAYFFKMSKYADRLLRYIEENPDFIQPESRKNEMINNFIKPGLQDLCVSRSSFDWGIPVPVDEKHVIYVWIDALSNYITALGYENGTYSDFDRYWPADLQIIGKDILRFHTIYWPILLMALDLPLPKQVFGHGWLLVDGGKMSKSKGNVVDPEILAKHFGIDAIRYYLLREIPFGQDGLFTNELFIKKINSDLANDLGNLLSRTVAMIEKYQAGVVLPAEFEGEFEASLKDTAAKAVGEFTSAMDRYRVSDALDCVWQLISRANKYIDETMPWSLAKNEEKKAELQAVLYNLAETLRIVSILIKPFMPDTSEKIAAQLGLGEDEKLWESAESFGGLRTGKKIVKAEALFPRIDIEEMIKILEAENEAKKAAAAKAETPDFKQQVSIDEFQKIDLRAAEILECEKVPKSDKLLRLIVDDGHGKRQLVSGIAQYYKPEDLIGKKVAVVANLLPAKLRGVESNGMILAADSGDGVKVLFLDRDIENGSVIR